VIVSGFHPVRQVLELRPRSVETLWVLRGRRDARASEIEDLARAAGVSVRPVGRGELDRLAGKGHNGVAARVAVRPYDDVEACLAGADGRRTVLFLDQVADPGNVGAILRTAAAAGASVVLTERHSAPLGLTTAKAAAGALERVNVGRCGNASQFLRRAREVGFWIFGADPSGRSLWESDLSGDVLLCLGSEGEGLRRLTREACDQLVAIPMAAGAGSLNVSVAAGILLYEVARRRSKEEGTARN
jgi:23S rRNA (guanosine2251-2'-O)-methyltransferase